MSRSIFCGKAGNNPLLHIASTDGLSPEQLTSGVRSDTLFHSDLPYLMADRYELPLTYRGNVGIMYPAKGYGTYSRKWYRLTLPGNIKNAMASRVFLLLMKTTSGQILSPASTHYSWQKEFITDYPEVYPYGIFHQYNARFIGDFNLSYVFHNSAISNPAQIHSAPSYWPSVWTPYQWAGVNAQTGMTANQNYLSIFSSYDLAGIIIAVFNVGYSGSSLNYINLVSDSDDVYLSKNRFRIGSLDLSQKAFLKDNDFSANAYAGDSLITSPSQYSPGSVYAPGFLTSSGHRGYARLSGGHGTSRWEMDLDKGIIKAFKDDVGYAIFGGDYDAGNKLRYGQIRKYASAGVADYISSTYVTKTYPIGSQYVGSVDELTGIFCILPGDTILMAGRSGIDRNNPRGQGRYVWYPMQNGFSSVYVRLKQGMAYPVFFAGNFLQYSSSYNQSVSSVQYVYISVWLEYGSDGYLRIKAHYHYESWGYDIFQGFVTSYCDIPASSFHFITLR